MLQPVQWFGTLNLEEISIYLFYFIFEICALLGSQAQQLIRELQRVIEAKGMMELVMKM